MCKGLALTLSLWCGLAGTAARAEPSLELQTRFTADYDPYAFGGMSGLLMSDNGRHAQILTDRGKLMDIQINRNNAHHIVGLELLTIRYLKLANTTDPDYVLDTEGLARAPDGGLYVSLEQPARVLHYPPNNSFPTPMPAFPDLTEDESEGNQGFEAVATSPSGQLVVLLETPPENSPGHPLFGLTPDGWEILRHIPKTPDFLMVGADFGPDGQLYLLERAVSLLGFRSRVSRLSLNDPDASPQLLWTSGLGTHDNLEGLDVWQDTQDQTRITLVSDNNFLTVQVNELVEFVLKE